MEYKDRFCIIETTEQGIAYYCDQSMNYFEMSNAVAEYLINKLDEKNLSTYRLIDYAEKLSYKRELKLYTA